MPFFNGLVQCGRMLSLHSFFARLVASFVARRPTSAARMLVRFARAELGSSLVMRWAAAATPSPERRAAYLLHALDEERHARFFAARARKLGTPAHSIVADADDLFHLLGERRFVAFVHRAEARGEREFVVYERSFRRANDGKTAAVFEAVLRDERRHVEYSQGLFAELGVTRATSIGVALWEALRASRRATRALFGAVNHLFLLALYATLLPFSLAMHLRTRSKRGAPANVSAAPRVWAKPERLGEAQPETSYRSWKTRSTASERPRHLRQTGGAGAACPQVTNGAGPEGHRTAKPKPTEPARPVLRSRESQGLTVTEPPNQKT